MLAPLPLTTVAAAGDKTLLRFLTGGSVDDGKSTLIGRLLFETGALFDDQLASLRADSARQGATSGEIDFALALDGLEQEREQGITIDVAYRYFSSPRRKFIVVDAPGHQQFTRNMATGASNCEAVVLLIDARKGILEQTRRHSIICSLLGIRHVVLAVNKIDLVDFSLPRFREIEAAYCDFASTLGFNTITALPTSARHGDNVVQRSTRLSWFSGPTLLESLEAIEPNAEEREAPFRMPIQSTLRPNADFRGFAGTIAGGTARRGMRVVAAQSKTETRIARIVTANGDLDEAGPGEAVVLTLADEIDLARGDVLADPTAPPEFADQFAANLIWLSEVPLIAGRPYLLRIGGKTVPASLTALKHRINVNTLDHSAGKTLEMNEVGYGTIASVAPIAFDPYRDNRDTGAFVLIDRISGATCGAGMIVHGMRRATNVRWQNFTIERDARASLKAQRPCVVWFTGLSGSGKSTVANAVERKLHALGHHTMILDGDNVRHGLNRDLGFTAADRVENIRRVGEVAKLMAEAGLIVLCCFISPYRTDRQSVREIMPAGEFIEAFIDAPLDICIARDPKGLYEMALDGRIPNFTGISAPYEPPLAPELVLQTARVSPDSAADLVIQLLVKRAFVAPLS